MTIRERSHHAIDSTIDRFSAFWGKKHNRGTVLMAVLGLTVFLSAMRDCSSSQQADSQELKNRISNLPASVTLTKPETAGSQPAIAIQSSDCRCFSNYSKRWFNCGEGVDFTCINGRWVRSTPLADR